MKNLKCCRLSHKASFIAMISLTATFFFVEIIIGYITNSMALVADSFHMLSDVVSLLVGYIALRYSKIGQQTGRYTFGWARAEVLGALVNAVFLVALCFSILVEALKRMVIPEPLDNPKLVLITGAVGLFVNIIGLFLFHQHGHSHGGGHSHSHGDGHTHSHGEHKYVKPTIENSKDLTNNHVDKSPGLPLLQQNDYEIGNNFVVGVEDNSSTIDDEQGVEVSATQLNIRGVYLHVLGDALGSVIVIISALIILYEHDKWTQYVDPSMSIFMVLIILKTSIPLLKESSMILMQTVPTHIKIQEIQDRLVQRIPGVLSVHEFHIWQLAGNKIIASAHVRCRTLPDYMAIANQVKEFFHNEGIHSTTIQPEFVEPLSHNLNADDEIYKSTDSCVLECNEVCSERTCCGSSVAQGGAKNCSENPSPKHQENINMPVCS